MGERRRVVGVVVWWGGWGGGVGGVGGGGGVDYRKGRC